MTRSISGDDARFARLHNSLPIFGTNLAPDVLVYVPGHVMTVPNSHVGSVRSALAEESAPGAGTLAGTIEKMKAVAEDRARAWRQRFTEPFKPECLTIYFSCHCNLACEYCYAGSGHGANDGPVVTLDAATAAAEAVAASCARMGRPFRLVLHGGGEPTVHWELLQQIVATTREIAASAGVEWLGHIATNGVMPEDHAVWLACNMTSVGLSCDGPPDIQDRSRPLRGGGASSPKVERFARVLLEQGVRPEVRATVQPENMSRQAEMVDYLHFTLGAADLRFEPAYNVHSGSPFAPEEAEEFCRHFMAAEQRANEVGCRLSCSLVRLDELHGPFCDPPRNVLHLVPDGSISSCFFSTGSDAGACGSLGHWDPSAGRLELDEARIDRHIHACGEIPEPCLDCLCLYHCSRGCPEHCLHSEDVSPPIRSFRCRVSRLLATSWIIDAAGGSDRDTETVESLLAEITERVDSRAILEQWNAVRRRRKMASRPLPGPIWARRGFEHGPGEAWENITALAGRSASPISVYVHVPFCDRRCAFCDCYSVVSGNAGSDKMNEYVQSLLQEIEAWANLDGLAGRPVTTVHFGGGTPNHLPHELLARVVDSLRSRLCMSQATELALESTTSLIAPHDLEFLTSLGFTRLHVGVQTLEDDARRAIGRREPAGTVLDRLSSALDAGLVVSVDLIYGLPGQTAAGLLSTIADLVSIGVHGFSLYQLQVSHRNQQFVRRSGVISRPIRDFTFLQIAEQALLGHGFRKTHFTHFARPEDTNLYYAHVLRGEDLLALGSSADGLFGSYHYRHPETAEYLAGRRSGRPPLQGGVLENPVEQLISATATRLMAGRVSAADLLALGAGALIESWCDHQLIRPDGPGMYVLTANGSWYVSDMLDELAATQS